MFCGCLFSRSSSVPVHYFDPRPCAFSEQLRGLACQCDDQSTCAGSWVCVCHGPWQLWGTTMDSIQPKGLATAWQPCWLLLLSRGNWVATEWQLPSTTSQGGMASVCVCVCYSVVASAPLSIRDCLSSEYSHCCQSCDLGNLGHSQCTECDAR